MSISSTIVDVDPSFSYVVYTPGDPVSGIATVETAVYSAGYEGRWRLTRLEVKPEPDLLDRIKARAYAVVGSETEETFEGTSLMLGTCAGKVRALREVQGAASGPGTTHLDVFYRDLWRRTLNLRVHPMPHIWYYWDYLPPSSPGAFYSSTLPGRLALDGANDAPADGTPPTWSRVSLPDGTLVFYRKELTSFPARDPICTTGSGVSFYWRDDDRFDDLLGDDTSAYGNHGLHIECTADTNVDAYSSLMTHYPLPPQQNYAPVGDLYAVREETPLMINVESQTRAATTGARLIGVERADGGRITLTWTDVLGEDAYEIYRGILQASFIYNHDTPVACDLPADTTTWTSPDDQESGQPPYYSLIVPRTGATRDFGTHSSGAPRPPSSTLCP